MNIQPNIIKPQEVEHFAPDGTSLGFLNEFENTDLRIQIAENQVSGYYLITNDRIKVEITADGDLMNWPSGLYDIQQRQIAKLIRIRRSKLK